MKLLVGLGNPGQRYQFNRHNVGFIALDLLAQEHGISLSEKKFDGIYGKGEMFSQEVILLKPQTFMNLSGKCVVKFLQFFKISLEDVTVIYDDLDLESGVIKSRTNGGHGGHNGIRSMIEEAGDHEFKRLKYGIGRPDPAVEKMDVSSWVLSDFTSLEAENLRNSVLNVFSTRIKELWRV